jgi:HEPN domain-containing protein
MSNQRDLGHAWLQKAQSDLHTARQLLATDGPYDTACFHAQQAAEKALKAVLAQEAQQIPRTHDLGELAGLVGKAAISISLSDEDLANLTPYAVALRYDIDFWPDREVAQEAVEKATVIVEGVSNLLAD